MGPGQINRDPIDQIIAQVMNSADPQAAFNAMVRNNPAMQNALVLINQYGNGDPKAAFMNYAQQKGMTSAAENIMQQLGLK